MIKYCILFFFGTCGFLGLDICTNSKGEKSAMVTSTVGGVCDCCRGYTGEEDSEKKIKVL